jgi:hypothetical protein
LDDVVDCAGQMPWNPDRRVDSLGVLVGAGKHRNHARTAYTNYGERVTCQGWGQGIVAPNAGASRQGRHDCFAPGYSATSAATAMVAGVAACIQAFRKKQGKDPLTPEIVRELLGTYGTRQPDEGTGRIGPLPDLALLLPKAAALP